MKTKPNIVFIIADDHAVGAMGCYGSYRNGTPNLDRIADEGVLFENSFCTNAICTPSRATLLTGAYGHRTGVTTLRTPLDNRLPTFAGALGQAGYRSAIFGKWHVGHGPAHDPVQFDDWAVFPGQGDYFNPEFLTPGGAKRRPGYATEVLTDMALDWIGERDRNVPFALVVGHKAPHRRWELTPDLDTSWREREIPVPPNLHDDFAGRAYPAAEAKMRIHPDLDALDLKRDPPPGLDGRDLVEWKYQRYIQDYLATVESIDQQTGRLLDFLDNEGLSENTLVVYTSDHGFFLGEHGWFDKRFMYEESMRVPLIMRLPSQIRPGLRRRELVANIDLAATLCDLADVPPPALNQGRSLVPLLQNQPADNWRDAVYYRYWMNRDEAHRAVAHCGVRTATHKFIRYDDRAFGQPGAEDGDGATAYEMFDLTTDPREMKNLVDNPAHSEMRTHLKARLAALQTDYGDTSPK